MGLLLWITVPKPVGPLSLHWSRPPHMPQESTFCFEPTMRSHPTAFIFGEEKMKKKKPSFREKHQKYITQPVSNAMKVLKQK